MKLIKLSVAALIALVLSACGDKPATTTSTPAKAETTQTVENKDTTAEDYKKFLEWQAVQEKALNDSTISAVANVDKNDAKALKTAIDQALLGAINNIKASAATLDIKDPKVNTLKEKVIEVMSLGAELVVEGEKLTQNPSQEAHKAFNDLKTKLEQAAKEGQAIEAELNQKYGPAPQSAPYVPQSEVSPASTEPTQK
ncbi:hypothetical protein B0187_04715 [Haemophilus paracuniculus]|uniref:Lipoprotein HlpB n=1 Tax=Haemophilus paracuniculus TaxID=734 RepID=A0A1T0AT02_9PAST|nr:hypothetical protein [Haemophilus paracuniculus]OOR99619.1 hypothetical protein B0187_04715 [Haemophilus paracuniculus]